ncbi:MAG TPA: ATP-binding cassette domain-containing protein [Capillibacterium sp.]
MIQLENVCFSLAGREILSQLSLTVPAGQTYVLLGPSGCGKSTVLRLVMGLIRPNAGRILIDGLPLADTQNNPAGPTRGMVFQSSALFDFLTVYENIALGLRKKGNLTEAEIKERVRQELDRVGLGDDPDLLGKTPAELSGGMQKRVAIARTLALDPKIILYDEPTTGLDPIMAGLINDLIRRVHRRLKITSILVTHDLNCALRVGDEIGLLYQGKIRESAPARSLPEKAGPLLRQFLDGRLTGPITINGGW